MRRNALLLSVLVMQAVALVPMPVLAGQSGASADLVARVQILEDREAIRALMVEYGRRLDARDFAGFAQLFARDAEFVSGGGGGVANGPAAIGALLERLLTANAAPAPGRDFHILENVTVNVQGDRATALSKGAFVVTSADNRLETRILANYHDEFVREDGQWKFKRRQIGDAPRPSGQSR